MKDQLTLNMKQTKKAESGFNPLDAFVMLRHGDCLDIMPELSDKSIDMILTDLPYGVTKIKWDSIIDLYKMWNEIHRITKIDGAIVLFGTQPFVSKLVSSNYEDFKYDNNYLTQRK